MKAQRWKVDRWTVDYGDGREAVSVPHAWKQDMDVRAEGPVVYRAKLHLPPEPAHLLFHGVSYAAEVFVNGESRILHEGLWDAFEVPLSDLAGEQVEVKVRVMKNGGKTYPVSEVASGFLPYVFNTFGGIYRDVELVLGQGSPLRQWRPHGRHEVRGRQILVGGQPFYPRGLLHWGWYPEVGHANPPEATIRKEIQRARDLGFNLIKFCLWVPPPRYLELMRQEGMEAWIELPIWAPSTNKACQSQIEAEVEAIVRQYRQFDNILFWSIGCELGKSVSAETRHYLCAVVRNLTGSSLVGDSSGGAEMFGGDLEEFGDFADFHPYCDLPFYPPMLDSLDAGPRSTGPVLFGEFNDVDVHRDLAKVHDEMPYWASSMAELNDKGLRATYHLPDLITHSRFVQDVDANRALIKSSQTKAAFQRKTIQEWVRSRPGVAGFVITGWRDTPISTSGFFDDWNASRFDQAEVLTWNSADCLFLIPHRLPTWTNGGNRPGFVDSLNVFTGENLWRVGIHTERGCEGGLVWRMLTEDGETVARGTAAPVEANGSMEVGTISWSAALAGRYRLEVEFGTASNSWPISVVAPLDAAKFVDWSLTDPRGLLPELNLAGTKRRIVVGATSDFAGGGIAFLLDEGTIGRPFWREAAYEFSDDAFWRRVPFREEWSRLLCVSPDRVIDENWLRSTLPADSTIEVLMNRIDMRSYEEAPIVVRVTTPEGGKWIITTLRPFGGLGIQPTSLAANPAGSLLLQSLVEAST